MQALQTLTRAELTAMLLPQVGHKAHLAKVHAQQIFRWVYQRFVWDWQAMSDLPQGLRQWLQANLSITQLDQFQQQVATDGTMKFLWKLHDQKTIESVLIPAKNPESQRLTLCISSQVGCAMGCKFCLTAVQGLDRNLSSDEIVAQVMLLRKMAPVTNVVFMGMGEPLHNVDNVIQACKIILDQEGMNFSKRKVTVSTSGVVSAMDKVAKEVGVMLAVSLNASMDEQRQSIMPVNKKWNIETLLQAAQKYSEQANRMITYEYVLLADINDSLEDARRLSKLIRRFPAKINLIPFNEHPGSDFKRPSREKLRDFHQHLNDQQIVATIRHSRGRDILAACGQLRSLYGTAKGTKAIGTPTPQ